MGFGPDVTAVGMASSLGSALGACAAVRGGLNQFSEYADHLCKGADPAEIEPLVGALAGPAPRTAEALVGLFVEALQDLLRRARLTRRDLAGIPILVSLPSPERSPRDRALSESFLAAVAARAGARLDPASVVLDGGHAGVLLGVQRALMLLNPRDREAVIVGGVESYFAPEALVALDDACRLKSRRSSDAFIPGECAVALLLEGEGAAALRDVAPLASLGLPGFGFEPSGLGSGDPSTGAGLCEAITAAMGPDPGDVAWVLGDLNGESYRAAEWARARVRLSAPLGRARLWHPADCLGDVGAATGGALLAVATAALGRSWAPGPRALVFTGSDDGTRAALSIERAAAPGG